MFFQPAFSVSAQTLFRRTAWVAIALAAGVGRADGLPAQSAPSDANQQDVRDEVAPRGLGELVWLFRSERVLNTPVVNPDGQSVGRIEELVIDAHTGSIRYVAIDFPTWFGAEKLLAVPWSKLTLRHSPLGLNFAIQIPEAQLRKAPGFDRDAWPNVANRKWAEQIDIYYGMVVKAGDLKSDFGTDVRPIAEVPYLMRSRQIRGLTVTNRNGDELGRVAELISDLGGPGIRYAVIELSDVKANDKLFPAPFTSLQFHPGDEQHKPRFALRVEHILLGRAPFFAADNWPDLLDPRWSAKVDHYFGADLKLEKE